MAARISGFNAVNSDAIAGALGGLAGQRSKWEMDLANAGIRAEAVKRGAEIGADLTRYAGQQAADSTMFGSVVGGLSKLAAPVVGGWASGAFSGARPTDAQLVDQFTRNENAVKSSYEMPDYGKPISWSDDPFKGIGGW